MNSSIFNPVAGSLLLLLLLTAVLLVPVGIAGVQLYRASRALSWGEFKRSLARQRRIIPWTIGAAAVFGLLFFLASWMAANNSASALITLNYGKASNGQNANGTRYNMSQILCDEVLQRAIDKGAWEDVTPAQLKDCLTVEPLVQGDSSNEESYHIATEFLLNYTADRHTAHLDAETVVQLVSSAYKDYYIEQYTGDLDVLDVPVQSEDFDQMDYLDAVTYLENQAYEIENYMYGLNEENSSFVSSTGETFSAVAEKTANLSEEQIQNGLKAYILYYGISKDPENYIGRLQYQNKLLDYDRQKETASFTVRQDAISLYAEEMARIVLVPTWDDEGQYYMGRTKIGVDDMSTEAETHSQSAADNLKTIEENNAVIADLEGRTATTSAQVETMIDEITGLLQSYAEQAKAITREYTQSTMNQCISSLVTGASLLRVLSVSVVAAAVFLALLNLALMALRLPGGHKTDLYVPEEVFFQEPGSSSNPATV